MGTLSEVNTKICINDKLLYNVLDIKNSIKNIKI